MDFLLRAEIARTFPNVLMARVFRVPHYAYSIEPKIVPLDSKVSEDLLDYALYASISEDYISLTNMAIEAGTVPEERENLMDAMSSFGLRNEPERIVAHLPLMDRLYTARGWHTAMRHTGNNAANHFLSCILSEKITVSNDQLRMWASAEENTREALSREALSRFGRLFRLIQKVL